MAQRFALASFGLRSALMLTCLGGCSIKPPAEDLAAGERLLAGLTLGDSVGLATQLDPKLVTPQTWTVLRQLTDSFVRWQPDSARLVGWQGLNSGPRHKAVLTYQLEGPSRWQLLIMSVHKRSGEIQVDGVRWVILPAPLDSLHRFRLTGKPFGSYFVLVMAVVMAGISIVTAGIIAFSGMPRRWLWALVALIGFTRFTLEWTTNAVSYEALQAQLFSAGLYRPGPYAPWFVSFSLPGGALIAWRRLRRWQAARGTDTRQSSPP